MGIVVCHRGSKMVIGCCGAPFREWIAQAREGRRTCFEPRGIAPSPLHGIWQAQRRENRLTACDT